MDSYQAQKKAIEVWKSYILFELGLTDDSISRGKKVDIYGDIRLRTKLHRVGRRIAKLLEEAINCKLLGTDFDSSTRVLTNEASKDLVHQFVQWANKEEERQRILSENITSALFDPTPFDDSKETRSQESGCEPYILKTIDTSDSESTVPSAKTPSQKPKGKPSLAGDAFNTIPSNVSRETAPSGPAAAAVETLPQEPPVREEPPIVPLKAEQAPPASALWKYLPVPEGVEKHSEFFKIANTSAEGFHILGARVRGKKHKHEGTNCDDWFEFGKIGPWTLFAVSDGAGSKKLSRVGAKVACQAAVRSLSESLKEHRLVERNTWVAETFVRDEKTGAFNEPDLEKIQQALHNAILEAYEGTKKTAEELAGRTIYFKYLERDVEIDDLSATLLVAAHTAVKYKDRDYSFILACQVGDGMTAAIDNTGNLKLLGVADIGLHAGETDFLTSRRKWENSLAQKTYPFFRPLSALLIMSDGVADDYFPNDPGIRRLYADLILNSIIEVKGLAPDAKTEALAKTKLPTLDDVRKTKFYTLVDTIGENGLHKVKVRTIEAYAEKLGLLLDEVLSSLPLLAAGAVNAEIDPICPETSAEQRLCTWLDTYQVRGSFDDRTLVVMYRENLL